MNAASENFPDRPWKMHKKNSKINGKFAPFEFHASTARLLLVSPGKL